MRFLTAAFVLAAAASAQSSAPVAARAGLPGGANAFYAGNRAPLAPSPLVKLPVGAVKPGGWLKEQLARMADGFSGRLPELSTFCRFNDNAWTDRSGSGRFGWEELPYWLKGYIDLGYVLGDKRIIAEATRWVEAVLGSQQPDGWFGPRTNLVGDNTLDNLQSLDLWPNMVMLYVLRTHYEATGDRRVLPFITRYYEWFARQPLRTILPKSWQKYRGGDNLDSIYWLYNRTGGAWLLDAARINHERTADWVGSIPTWHGVNLSQCFREPAQYYQQTGDQRYLAETEHVYDTVFSLYGQVPGGLFASDENARPGFTGPRQGTETCTMVEFLHSHTMLAGISGDGKWLDRAEEIAFNSLPASMTPDLKGLHYLTAPNQIQLDRTTKAPLIENDGDMFSYNPYQYRCCQHNAAMGWPYYAERLWMATGSGGLAAALYAESSATAKAGAGGQTVTIEETTGYPFAPVVELTIRTAAPVRFPLALRIPNWASQPTLTINGAAVKLPAPEKGFVTVEREWAAGDRLALTLPMSLSTERWKRQGNAASVRYGPLWFSLQIGEKWRQYGDKDAWAAHEVFPTTAWNYALDLSRPVTVTRSPAPPAAQPFTPEAAPVTLRATARRVPEWRQEPNGLIGEIQQSPVRSTEKEEEIALIPMGCARLRISVFPVAGSGQDAAAWDDNPGLFTAEGATPFDYPGAAGGYAFGGRRGGVEVVEQSFSWPKTVSRASVEWGKDAAPRSWRILYQDGDRWLPVRDAGPGRFEPVTARRFRLEVRMEPRRGARLAGWRLSSGIN